MVVMGILNSVINKMNQVLSGGADYIVVQGETIAPKRFSFMDLFLPGMIAMSAMTTSIFAVVEISSRYRETGIFRKLATTPLRRIEWILSKTIYQIVISFAGMGVILGLGIALFDVKVIPDPLSLILVATTSMLFSGIGMILSRFVKDPETAGAAANAITFPMMFLSGTFFPLEQMPEFLRTIATVLRQHDYGRTAASRHKHDDSHSPRRDLPYRRCMDYEVGRRVISASLSHWRRSPVQIRPSPLFLFLLHWFHLRNALCMSLSCTHGDLYAKLNNQFWSVLKIVR